MRILTATSLSMILLGAASAQNLVYVTNDDSGGGVVSSTAGGIGAAGEASNTLAVSVFDINRDGFDDVFFLNHDSSGAVPSVGFLSDGGTPAMLSADANGGALYTATQDAGAKGMAVLDWDGDTDMDVFIATGPTSSQNDDLWLRNDSTGLNPFASSFSLQTTDADYPQRDDHSYDAEVFMLNGVQAIAVACRIVGGDASNGGENRIYTNDGDGTFTEFTAGAAAGGQFHTTVVSEIRSARALAVADFDEDGDDDIVAANAGNVLGTGFQANELYRQGFSGSATLITSTPFLTLTDEPSYGVDVADLNADGAPDVLFANRMTAATGAPNTLWMNDNLGSGFSPTFTAVTATVLDDDRMGGDASYDLCFADLDGDGDEDLIVANNIDDNAIYMNQSAAPESETPFGADHFLKIEDGLLQSNAGKTRAVGCAEFGDYGPADSDAFATYSHNGLEVVFGNTKPGNAESRANEFYRSMGAQVINLGGQTDTTAIGGPFTGTSTLTLSGFLSPASGGEMVVSSPHLPDTGAPPFDIVLSSFYITTVRTSTTYSPTIGMGTAHVDSLDGFGLVVGPFPFSGGESTLTIGPVAALTGQQFFLQASIPDPVITDVAPSLVGIGTTNALSVIIQ